MHEAGLLAAAVAEALAAAGPGRGRPIAVEIRVHDPIHVAPESARMHAELALRARGLFDIPIEVTADPVECAICGAANEAHADHPFCSRVRLARSPTGVATPSRDHGLGPGRRDRAAGRVTAPMPSSGLGNRLEADEALGALVIERFSRIRRCCRRSRIRPRGADRWGTVGSA